MYKFNLGHICSEWMVNVNGNHQILLRCVISVRDRVKRECLANKNCVEYSVFANINVKGNAEWFAEYIS